MLAYLEKYGQLFITLAAIIGAFAALVAIIGQRFDAQERLNGQFFQLVNQRLDLVDQRFDAQEKLMNERFNAQDQRFNAQDQRMNERFDAQEKLMNERFERVYQRLDAQGKRLDRLTDEVADLRGLMVSITERVSRNEGEIGVIRDQLRIADTPSP